MDENSQIGGRRLQLADAFPASAPQALAVGALNAGCTAGRRGPLISLLAQLSDYRWDVVGYWLGREAGRGFRQADAACRRPGRRESTARRVYRPWRTGAGRRNPHDRHDRC
ncbi:MAG: hypothetical protein H6643_13220 [Caldilineaceae bacterium]|nr:hypothetical protein [Caldilineaceae bacterium]